MFEVGFSELLLIAAIALIVLGPQRLPKLAAQVGRWMGRARSMARQFREQLEDEAILEENRQITPQSTSNTSATNKFASSSGANTIAPAAGAGALSDTSNVADPAGLGGVSSTLSTGIPPDDDYAHNPHADLIAADLSDAEHASADATHGDLQSATAPAADKSA
jgi:sec-independent protein translocase protein TatB